MGHRISRILSDKRDGRWLTQEQIELLIAGFHRNTVSPTQMAAFCSFVYWQGMNIDETVYLTQAIANSGRLLNWDTPKGVDIIDKHSTGGVGDKVSLVLAPLWATLGYKVPMVSARGMGHTGGTLDKLESIPNIQTSLSEGHLQRMIEDVGCFICGNIPDLVPVDKRINTIRNATSTVSSTPLIVASILSKKLAEGIKRVVVDVKYGVGAFMKTQTQAYRLADFFEKVGEGIGLKVVTALTDMNQPLGRTVGNRLEVLEAIECLKGAGPTDVVDLVCELAQDERSRSVLESGQALETFERMVQMQGGDLSLLPSHSPLDTVDIRANNSGTVTGCDAYLLGDASLELGCGRVNQQQNIHHGVGILVEKKVGESVSCNEVLARLVVCENSDVAEAVRKVQQAYTIQ